jgi:hypothetical protein
MFQSIYDEYVNFILNVQKKPILTNALRAQKLAASFSKGNGFQRIKLCRKALAALDKKGWLRSYHQKQFHETFMRACARVFWKTEKPGQFAQDHQKILQVNGWDHLSQEILVSTPRRWSKLRCFNICFWT